MKKVSLILAVLMILTLPANALSDVMNNDLIDDEISANSNNVIVIVPGIVGSELYNINGNKVWVGVGALLGEIECSPLGVPRYTLMTNSSDTYGANDTYQTLYDNLYLRYSNNADIKFFSYDWRLSCATAGQALKNLVSGYSGKIILVTHSMGGLVASEYLRLATANQRARTTLITLGTPFTGAPKAVRVMETGEMFDGILGTFTKSYVQNLVRNLPAAYQLLPTSRSSAFIQVNGVDQTNANAWEIMRQRSWCSNGSSVKPMMNAATSFHANLMQSNGQSYALAAGTARFISSVGYTTIQKVNYSLSNGVYSLSSYTTSNSGDGTVPSRSAQNTLSNSSGNVVYLQNAGDHVGMVANNTILSYIYQLINSVLTNSASVNEFPIESNRTILEENERGWIVGEGIDGRRIRVIIRGSTMPTVRNSSGELYTQIGDGLYVGSNAEEAKYVGSCWPVSNGYQFEMMNGDYTFEYSSLGKSVEVEVSYMNNGYYEMSQMYKLNTTGGHEFELELSDHSTKNASMRSINGEFVEPVTVADRTLLLQLNTD